MSGAGIADYLDRLAADLPADLLGRDRILAEVADHLAESAAGLTAEGRPIHEAEAAAIARFGEPRELAAVFRAVAREGLDSPPTTAEQVLSGFAGAAGILATLGLLAVAGWSLLDPDPITARAARAAGLLAASLLAGGVVAWLFLRRRLRAAARRSVVAFVPLALVPMGISAIIGTLELGRASGDYEFYGVGIGLALVVQGLLAAWLVRPRRARPVSG